jgi:hypothetical protein
VRLLQKQQRFVFLVVRLINWLHVEGYDVTFGETWRPPEQAARNAQSGKGIQNSLHELRLAIDLNIFKNGSWRDKTEDFRRAGEFWESLSTDDLKCCWGGRFGDGNHFSVEHGGVR